MQLETLDAPALINYIKELENNFEVRIKESEYKYLELKERYDLLVYKRFGRSAEQNDDKQQSLFAEEEQARPEEPEDEKQEIKSYSRRSKTPQKPGRKPIDPNIPREERIIDIPESEKVCACGADLTRIGEESAA